MGMQIVKQCIQFIASNTKAVPSQIKLNSTTIATKKKRNKPSTKQHTKQERNMTKGTQANFTTPKQKHSPEWLHMLQKVLNLHTTNKEHNNHAESLSRRLINNPINNDIIKPQQRNATHKINADPSTHATSPPTRPISSNDLHPGSNTANAEDQSN